MIHNFQQGIALVLVLWALTLLTVMATTVTITTRADLSMARNRIMEAQRRAISDAAIALVTLRLMSPENNDHWLPDGQPHQWLFNGQIVEIRLYNEGSRIDLNGATDILLASLLQIVGVSATDAIRLANAIIDWRDVDDLTSIQGAETPEYKAAGRTYGSKNAAFDSIAELRLVLGFTPELVNQLKDAVTVRGNGSDVLQDYASPLVLAALGVDAPPPPVADAPHNLGGPTYRIQVRIADGGPMQETLFRLGGNNNAQFTIIERN